MAEESNWGEYTLRERIKIEIDKFKKLSAKDKFEYYKSYYLKPTIIIFIVIVMLCMFLKQVVFDRKETIFAGCFLNISMSVDANEYLTDGFVKYMNDKEQDKQQATTTQIFNIRFENGEPINLDYNNVMAFNTRLQAQTEDYVMVGADSLFYVTENEVCADLTELMDADLLEELEPLLIYYDSEFYGKEIPVGIKLEGTEFAEQYELIPEDSYIVFVYGALHLDNAEKFVRYLYDK